MKLTKYKIKDIAKTSSGGTPKSTIREYYENGTIPWINSGELSQSFITETSNYITELGYKNSSAKIFPKDETVLLAMYGATAGKASLLQIDACTNQAICAIMPDKKVVEPLFLKYKLDTMYKYLVGLSTGSARDNLSQAGIGDIEIELPDLDTQRRIASVLSNLDRKIALNRQINTNLEALARQLYDYWFVQFDFPDANGKPYKSSGGKMVYNEKLKREIPDGWEYLTTNKLTNVITGKEDANFSVANGKYSFFTCSRDNLRCATPAFSGKAVLIAGNGEFNVKHFSGEFNAYQRTYVLIPNNEMYYGVLYFAALERINLFKANSNGSIIKFITKGDVENIGVFNCHKPEIYQQINTLIDTIENNVREISSLTKQRDELLPLLMNGQVTIE